MCIRDSSYAGAYRLKQAFGRKEITMEFVKAFLVGGVICALVQILMDNTKLMPGRIMVLLVVSGTILGALGLYQPFADWAGAGATVPLLGFGNTLWKGVWKSMGEDLSLIHIL